MSTTKTPTTTEYLQIGRGNHHLPDGRTLTRGDVLTVAAGNVPEQLTTFGNQFMAVSKFKTIRPWSDDQHHRLATLRRSPFSPSEIHFNAGWLEE